MNVNIQKAPTYLKIQYSVVKIATSLNFYKKINYYW